METQTKSLFAKAHEAFWDAKAEQYIDEALNGFNREENIKNAFIGYVLMDWVYDVNTELINLPGQITGCWDSYEKYDQWLLRSMLYPERIIEQIEKIFNRNRAEIIRLLGDDDPSYINDFSADFYYCNGIDVPDK